MRIAYPSDGAPEPPHLVLDIPDGWHRVLAPGTLLAARERGDQDGGADVGRYAANVIATWTREAPGFEVTTALAALDAQLAALPEARLLAPAEIAADEAEAAAGASARGVVFVDPVIGTLAQFHRYAVVVQGVCADVVHLTATIAGDQVAEKLPAVWAMLEGAEVTPPPDRPGAHPTSQS